MSQAILVFCMLPDTDQASAIARTLVEEKLAACVNLLPKIHSIYRWQGQVAEDTEILALIKTEQDLFKRLRIRLVELHPYECPEVIAVDIAAGHPPYLAWITESTGNQG